MKAWWLNLNLREKQTVSLGGLALIIALLYFLIWAPLSNSVATFRDQIQHNQNLLAWMKTADTKIQAAEKMGQAPAMHSTGSHLSIVQNELKKSPLANNITQLVQADNDSVKLSFQRVDFDSLLSWLTELWQQQGFIVTQLTAKAVDAPGMVSAELILS